jgi:DNA-binding NarL/FixJ family response regulator
VDRDALAAALVGVGQRPCAADTFLAGVRLLQDQNLRIEVALVDLLVRQRTGLAVLTFLAEDFPGVRRVLVARDRSAPELELARSSGRAESILIKPCDTRDLATALGLSGRGLL